MSTLSPGLYIVSTPIGNMQDISIRALDTLGKSDYILSEDTRVTKKLLDKHSIKSKLKIYNDHSNESDRLYIKSLIDKGCAISLVSDAGTPMISDPGYKLVRMLQDEGYLVDILPGCCSVIAALTLSGMPTDRFIFCGFLPKTLQSRKKVMQNVSSVDATAIFFETSDRLIASLEAALDIFGDVEAAVVREITKMYQEHKRMSISQLINYFQCNPARGEIVLLISHDKKDFIDVKSMAMELLNRGFSAKDVVSKLDAQNTNISKKEIYRIVNDVKNEMNSHEKDV